MIILVSTFNYMLIILQPESKHLVLGHTRPTIRTLSTRSERAES
jgi:hypothetical protein